MAQRHQVPAEPAAQAATDSQSFPTDPAGWTSSSSTTGLCVGHIAPEAVDGGPIAFVADGDPIVLDVANRTLEVEIDDAELARRKEGWVPQEPKYTRGVLGKYAKVVQSAAHGAVCG